MMLYSGETMEPNIKQFPSKSEISEFSLNCVSNLEVISNEKDASESKGKMVEGNGFIWPCSLCNHNIINSDDSEEGAVKASNVRCYFTKNFSNEDYQNDTPGPSAIGDVIPEFHNKLRVFEGNESDCGIFSQASKHNILQEPYGDTKNFGIQPATENSSSDSSFFSQYFCEDSGCVDHVSFNYQQDDLSCVENHLNTCQKDTSENMNNSIMSDQNHSQEQNLSYLNKNWSNSLFTERPINTCTYFWQQYGSSDDSIYEKSDVQTPASLPFHQVSYTQDRTLTEWNPALEETKKKFSQTGVNNTTTRGKYHSENPPITPEVMLPSLLIKFTQKFLLNCSNDPLSWVFPEDLRRFVPTGDLPLKQMTLECQPLQQFPLKARLNVVPWPPCPSFEVCRTMDHIYFYECLNAYAWGLNRINSGSSQRSRKYK